MRPHPAGVVVLIVLLAAIVPFAFCVTGVDFSAQGGESLGYSDFQCLVNNGISFTIIQTWQGGYQWNTAIAQNVQDAWNAGMAHVDVYIFMCPNCYGNGDAAGVINTVVSGLANQGVKYGMLWFDIEQCTDCWYDAGTNANYLAAAVNQAVSMGVVVGIYSSEYEWGATVGGYSGFSSYPLWYAHYDGIPSFSDGLYQFGGWSYPNIKQYNDQGPCFDVDVNWYPDSFLEHRAALLNGTIKQKPIDINELNAYLTNLQKK